MSAATAQVFGLIIVALALTLAATKLVADYFTPRKNGEAKAVTAGRPNGWGLFRRTRGRAAGRPAANVVASAGPGAAN